MSESLSESRIEFVMFDSLNQIVKQIAMLYTLLTLLLTHFWLLSDFSMFYLQTQEINKGQGVLFEVCEQETQFFR